MPDIELRRRRSGGFFDHPPASVHPGLFLSRGAKGWKTDPTEKGKAFQDHVAKTAGIAPSEIYRAAYHRWYRLSLEDPATTAWAGNLDGRMFIGLGGPSVIETAVTLSRTYGVPMIPGSAVKGLARAYAAAVELETDDLDILFGREGQDPGSFEGGYAVFHDAWWIPDTAPTPLAREIVTVHHPEYYKQAGAIKATDFDSPVPNVQVAVRGGFLFAVTCADPAWAGLGCGLISKALQQWGIGGKTAAGYGRFTADENRTAKFRAEKAKIALAALSPEERLRTKILDWTEKQLAVKFGKDRNKTRRAYGEQWETLLDIAIEHRGEVFKGWKNETEKSRRRAYDTVILRKHKIEVSRP